MDAKPNEIKITRLYDAPVKMVWDAWVDPKQAAKWWGPRGFTITTHSKDFRVGGNWHYTMHGPDGVDYPNKTIYHEIEKHSRMVYDHGGYDDRPPLFRVTVTFKDVKGKTQMDMIMALATPEAAKEIKKFIKQAGGNGTWDRLGEYLENEAGRDPFIINRSFEAPIAKVFEMWVNPDHLGRWLPPAGFTTTFIKTNIKTGGSNFYSMTNGEVTFYGKSHFLDVSPVHLIIYTLEFTDKEGKNSKHPMAPLFPAMMKNTVTFTEEGPNQTRITLMTEVYGEATQAERDFFTTAKSGMSMGWTGSFDKLEEML